MTFSGPAGCLTPTLMKAVMVVVVVALRRTKDTLTSSPVDLITVAVGSRLDCIPLRSSLLDSLTV